MVEDENGYEYYVHLPTGFHFYEKPPLLGSHGLVSTPRNWSMEFAATKVQKIWRAKRARRMLRKMLQNVFDKVQDEETGEYYYINRRTGEATWEKPTVLGSADIARRKAEDMTEEEAAIIIQRAVRGIRALKKLRQLVRDAYKKVMQSKRVRFPLVVVVLLCLLTRLALWVGMGVMIPQVWDEEEQAFYYENTITGETRWDKPKALGRADVSTVKYWEMTEEDAAIYIQRKYRAKRARHMLRAMVLEVCGGRTLTSLAGTHTHTHTCGVLTAV